MDRVLAVSKKVFRVIHGANTALLVVIQQTPLCVINHKATHPFFLYQKLVYQLALFSLPDLLLPLPDLLFSLPDILLCLPDLPFSFPIPNC